MQGVKIKSSIEEKEKGWIQVDQSMDCVMTTTRSLIEFMERTNQVICRLDGVISACLAK